MESPLDKIIVSTRSEYALKAHAAAVENYLSNNGDAVGLALESLQYETLLVSQVMLIAFISFGVDVDGFEPPKQQGCGTPRERALRQAASCLQDGQVLEACILLEKLVYETPNDMLALKILSDCYFFIGEYERLAHIVDEERWGALVAADPSLSKSYGYALGIMAFGLVEIGSLDRGLDTAHRAIRINPNDIWAIHAKAHYYEMIGHYEYALDWILSQRHYWDFPGPLRGHMWWHVALFYMGFRNLDDALKVYEENIGIIPQMSTADLIDASSLLWRLESKGQHIEQACWNDLSDKWARSVKQEQVQAGTTMPLILIHAALTWGRSRRPEDKQRLKWLKEELSNLQKQALKERHGQRMNLVRVAATTLSLVKGIEAFSDGDFKKCLNHILPIRHDVVRLGGSTPQRRLFVSLLPIAATIELTMRVGEDI